MNQFKYEELESRYIYYMKNYNPIFNYVHDMGETQVIIDPIDKVCRFCGKKYPEVKFKKKAHAISEMLGNVTNLHLQQASDKHKAVFHI